MKVNGYLISWDELNSMGFTLLNPSNVAPTGNEMVTKGAANTYYNIDQSVLVNYANNQYPPYEAFILPTSSSPTPTPTFTVTPSNSVVSRRVWNLYYPCDTTTPATQVIDYTANYLGGEIILGSNGLCYKVAITGMSMQQSISVVSEFSTCASCQGATPTPTPTSTPATTPTNTPSSTLPLLQGGGTYGCASSYGACDGTFTITTITGGSGGPYQTSLNGGGTWNPFSGSYTYTGLCGGTQYQLYLKDGSGNTRSTAPFTLCSVTSTPTPTPTPSPASPYTVNVTIAYDTSNTGTVALYQDTAGNGVFNLVTTLSNPTTSYSVSFGNGDKFYAVVTHTGRSTASQRGQIQTRDNGSDLYGNQSTTSGALPQSVTSTTTTGISTHTYTIDVLFGNAR